MAKINGSIEIDISENGDTKIKVSIGDFATSCSNPSESNRTLADKLEMIFSPSVACNFFSAITRWPEFSHIARDPHPKPYSIQRASDAIHKAELKARERQDPQGGSGVSMKIPYSSTSHAEPWVKAVLEHLEVNCQFSS